jgi:site-specific DNA recombinase
VDPDQVYMTTRLAGKDTVFLPFNKGNHGGAGNPENPGGYRNVKGPDSKNAIERDPEVAPIIVRLFERYAIGTFSVKEVARLAWEEGFRSRTVHGRVALATVHKILQNRIYSGYFDWNGKTYPGKYEALVSPDLWRRVGVPRSLT